MRLLFTTLNNSTSKKFWALGSSFWYHGVLVLALWNVMGLHYTVNNSTSKKFLALGSSFWRGLRNFGYVFAIFCTRQLVSKNVLHYVTEEYVPVL